MEEAEVPTEHLHEHMEHQAHHSGASWTMGVALSSAILAALAAVASLMAGHHVNEALIDQLKASDQWAYYQAKGIKAKIVEEQPRTEKNKAEIEKYRKEQEEIKKTAGEHERESSAHLHQHVILARAVTLFQVAIAVGAIAALTRRKPFWHVSMAFGAAGVVFLVQGLLAV